MAYAIDFTAWVEKHWSQVKKHIFKHSPRDNQPITVGSLKWRLYASGGFPKDQFEVSPCFQTVCYAMLKRDGCFELMRTKLRLRL